MPLIQPSDFLHISFTLYFSQRRVSLQPFIVIRQPTDYSFANPRLWGMRLWAGQSSRPLGTQARRRVAARPRAAGAALSTSTQLRSFSRAAWTAPRVIGGQSGVNFFEKFNKFAKLALCKLFCIFLINVVNLLSKM